MCRFIAYRGTAILLDELLIKPRNSLIRQSIHARETRQPLNGDGFGLGWYSHDIDGMPGRFVSTRPAWNDQNLYHLAPKIRSSCFFAHIRAASEGGISRQNCHPFIYGRMTFMHNGSVGGFRRLKRTLRKGLRDDIYDWIAGQTDSEHLFALFLDYFYRNKLDGGVKHLAEALRATIAEITELQRGAGVGDPLYLNMVVSDGKSIVASRYIGNPATREDSARSLYYACGRQLSTRDGICRLQKAGQKPDVVLVVSEKLDDHRADWIRAPENHLLLVAEDMSITLEALS